MLNGTETVIKHKIGIMRGERLPDRGLRPRKPGPKSKDK